MMGMDVRIVAPQALWNHDEVIKAGAPRSPRAPARGSRTPRTWRDGVRGVDFVYTDVWVSMGEPKEVWDERIAAAAARTRSRMDVLGRTGNPGVKFMHCLPAFHDRHTTVGQEIYEQTGHGRPRGHRRGLRVRRHSIVFDQAENRMHTIKAVMVATLGA